MSEQSTSHGATTHPVDDDQCRPADGLTWIDASFTLMRGGILALVIAVAAGCVAVLYRFPGSIVKMLDIH